MRRLVAVVAAVCLAFVMLVASDVAPSGDVQVDLDVADHTVYVGPMAPGHTDVDVRAAHECPVCDGRLAAADLVNDSVSYLPCPAIFREAAVRMLTFHDGCTAKVDHFRSLNRYGPEGLGRFAAGVGEGA